MLRSLRLRVAIVGVFLLVCLFYLLPNILEVKGALKRYLPSDKIRLGLDLKGGMHLVLDLDEHKMRENLLDRKFEALKTILITRGVRFLGLERRGEEFYVLVREEQREKLLDVMRREFPDLTSRGVRREGELVGASFTFLEKEMAHIKENALYQALETIRNRIDQFGVTEPVITKYGEGQILVELPGIKDPERALELIGRTAQLEFKLVDEENLKKGVPDTPPEGTEILPMRVKDREKGTVETFPILLKKETVLTGELLTDARVRFGGEFGNEPYVALEFNSEGARIFDRVTAENVGRRLAIVLDGVVYSAPVIRERISGGRASITGGFSLDEAKDLAIVLRAGALPAPVKVIQNITIGPSLGQDSIRKGIRATLLAGILVLVFMVVYYRVSGLIADLVLFLNILYLLGAFSAIKATLTLPGIAGIALTIGMGVDSNVLIFERIREELRLGRTIKAAIDTGYEKAWVTIFDSHVTTLITACVLFVFGTGPIKGFATTLILGMIINLFTAVFASKMIFDWMVLRFRPKRLSI
jgi:preprotein translocase subunit SecD